MPSASREPTSCVPAGAKQRLLRSCHPPFPLHREHRPVPARVVLPATGLLPSPLRRFALSTALTLRAGLLTPCPGPSLPAPGPAPAGSLNPADLMTITNNKLLSSLIPASPRACRLCRLSPRPASARPAPCVGGRVCVGTVSRSRWRPQAGSGRSAHPWSPSPRPQGVAGAASRHHLTNPSPAGQPPPPRPAAQLSGGKSPPPVACLCFHTRQLHRRPRGDSRLSKSHLCTPEGARETGFSPGPGHRGAPGPGPHRSASLTPRGPWTPTAWPRLSTCLSPQPIRVGAAHWALRSALGAIHPSGCPSVRGEGTGHSRGPPPRPPQCPREEGRAGAAPIGCRSDWGDAHTHVHVHTRICTHACMHVHVHRHAHTMKSLPSSQGTHRLQGKGGVWGHRGRTKGRGSGNWHLQGGRTLPILPLPPPPSPGPEPPSSHPWQRLESWKRQGAPRQEEARACQARGRHSGRSCGRADLWGCLGAPPGL